MIENFHSHFLFRYLIYKTLRNSTKYIIRLLKYEQVQNSIKYWLFICGFFLLKYYHIT
jgi:hypothetical protein